LTKHEGILCLYFFERTWAELSYKLQVAGCKLSRMDAFGARCNIKLKYYGILNIIIPLVIRCRERNESLMILGLGALGRYRIPKPDLGTQEEIRI